MVWLWVYYNGYSLERDNQIRNILEKEDNGSGYDVEGERDLTFPFSNKQDAIKNANKLMDLGLIKRFKLTFHHLN